MYVCMSSQAATRKKEDRSEDKKKECDVKKCP